jgi:lipid-binding SYLF domain-containing protein
VIIVFIEQKALDDFRNSDGWESGMDGSVAVVEWGVGGSVDTTNIKDPIIGFVFCNKEFMFNLALESSKISKIKRRACLAGCKGKLMIESRYFKDSFSPCTHLGLILTEVSCLPL